MAGIVEVEPLERGGPILEHADQLPRTQERTGQSFQRDRYPQPVKRRTNRQGRPGRGRGAANAKRRAPPYGGSPADLFKTAR
jgi:hypothetical protein